MLSKPTQHKVRYQNTMDSAMLISCKHYGPISCQICWIIRGDYLTSPQWRINDVNNRLNITQLQDRRQYRGSTTHFTLVKQTAGLAMNTNCNWNSFAATSGNKIIPRPACFHLSCTSFGGQANVGTNRLRNCVSRLILAWLYWAKSRGGRVK